MRTRWGIREDYRPLLRKALKLFPTMLGHVQPDKIFLCSFYKRRSQKMAMIQSVREPWSLLIPNYHYVIRFWASRFDRETEAYKLYVMVHELSHIPADGHKLGRSHRKLLGHDIEDFVHLRLLYGIKLGKIEDILKGEKALLPRRKGITRFPRTTRLG